MPLTPQVKVLSTSSTGIVVIDNTGAYDAISNPGGWGGPNPSKSSVGGILIAITPLSGSAATSARLALSDTVAYLYGPGYSITPPGPDGVYVITMRIGFVNGTQMTSDSANPLHFLMTGANTAFAGADGFTLDALNTGAYYQLDATQPPSATDGYVLSVLPTFFGQLPTIYDTCTINALVYQAGFNYLNLDIAKFASSSDCCAGEELDSLMARFAQYQGMLYKFNTSADYAGADYLAKKLQGDGTRGLTPCYEQGLTPNIPFVGNLPTITLQPVDEAVSSGAQVAFAVAASGTQPLSYQWYLNGSLLPGQTGSVLIIPAASVPNLGGYYCIVANAYGSVQSDTVELTIGASTTPVTIVNQPTNQNGTIGGSATFAVVVNGTSPITYQWYFNGQPIAGQTAASLTISNIQNANIGNYYVIATGPTNNVQSNTVTIALGVSVGWGWTANTVPLQSDINAAPGSASITSGSPLVADFRANNNFLILFAFEPTTEPLKTKWYGDVNNNGNIGNPATDLFLVTTIGNTRIYYTVYPTQNTSTPIQFLTSSQSPS